MLGLQIVARAVRYLVVTVAAMFFGEACCIARNMHTNRLRSCPIWRTSLLHAFKLEQLKPYEACNSYQHYALRLLHITSSILQSTPISCSSYMILKPYRPYEELLPHSNCYYHKAPFFANSLQGFEHRGPTLVLPRAHTDPEPTQLLGHFLGGLIGRWFRVTGLGFRV